MKKFIKFAKKAINASNFVLEGVAIFVCGCFIFLVILILNVIASILTFYDRLHDRFSKMAM